MENVVIVHPSEISWKDYKDLRLQALKGEPQAFGSSFDKENVVTDEEWKQRLSNYRDGKNNWMVFARSGNDLVGMLGAYQTEEDRNKKVANIIAMFVKKEVRGKGVSKMLMTSLLERLSKNPEIKKVTLAVNIEQEAALNLYKSFGFAIARQENTMLGDGKYHDEYVMEKELL